MMKNNKDKKNPKLSDLLKKSKFSVELDQQLRSFDDKEFYRAIQNKANKTFDKLFDELESGVINIYGKPGNGKTLIAHKLAYMLYQKGFNTIVTFDFNKGYNFITKEKVLLVKQGTIEISGLDYADDYGAESYQSFTNKRNGIAIIISTKEIMEYVYFKIEALGYENENVKGLLSTKKKIGKLIFSPIDDKKYADHLNLLINEAREEYHKTELEQIWEDLEYSTHDLIKFITIPKKIIFAKSSDQLRQTENAIIPLKILIFGDIGSGKSTLLEIIHSLLIEIYNQKSVHSSMHEYDLGILMQNGFVNDQDKFIQMIAVEDATYALPPNSDISHEWINLRHTLNERTGGHRADRSGGIQQAYVIAVLLLHRITGKACPIEFRNSFDLQFLIDIPTNKWDRDYIQSLLESSVYWTFLKEVVAERTKAKQSGNVIKYLELLGTGVCITKQEMFAFRLNLDSYNSIPIKLMDDSASWRNDWQDLAFQLVKKYENYSKIPPGYVIDHDITEYEISKYNRIRPASEGGINYRTRSKNMIKSLHGMYYSNSSLNQSINLVPQYSFINIEMDPSTDINNIMYTLFKKFAAAQNFEAAMDDYLDHTRNKSNLEIAENKNKNKSTVSTNIKSAKKKLVSSATGGIGFLWEQCIWILSHNLIKEKFGKAYITIFDAENEIIEESDKLILRDYREHKDLIFQISPPHENSTKKNSPIHSSPRTPRKLKWLGGKSAVDFVIFTTSDNEDILLEAKASTNRGDKCDCVIDKDKLCSDFVTAGGYIIHFHPWNNRAAYFKPDPPSRSLKRSRVVRGVLEELLLGKGVDTNK